jgi:hypothetical protein
VLERDRLAETGRDDDGDAERDAHQDENEAHDGQDVADRVWAAAVDVAAVLSGDASREGSGTDAQGKDDRQAGAEEQAGHEDLPGAVEGVGDGAHETRSISTDCTVGCHSSLTLPASTG